jgi:hypothetical protein
MSQSNGLKPCGRWEIVQNSKYHKHFQRVCYVKQDFKIRSEILSAHSTDGGKGGIF